jgi:micrococcal nuclease
LPFLLLFITAPVQLPETVITARVVGITDGDTIRALTNDNQSFRIRLRNIDAPEKGQAFGQAAKQNLSRYIFDHTVELHVFGTDRYGRYLAFIMLDGVDINLQQVKDGMAMIYEKYIVNSSVEIQTNYLAAQECAQSLCLGLWSEPDPIPPWEFRHSSH